MLYYVYLTMVYWNGMCSQMDEFVGRFGKGVCGL